MLRNKVVYVDHQMNVAENSFFVDDIGRSFDLKEGNCDWGGARPDTRVAAKILSAIAHRKLAQLIRQLLMKDNY